MDILEQLQDILITRSKGMDPVRFTVRGQWGIDLLFRPNSLERIFNYQIIVAQTWRQGCCYCCGETPKIDPTLMGLDVRSLSPSSRSLRIALLDAAFSAFNTDPMREVVLTGTSMAKAVERARILTDEVLSYLPERPKRQRPSVVNVGVVGNAIQQLVERGLEVFATDLDSSLIDSKCHGVVVRDGSQHTLELVEQCDIALVTGMTLSSGTLEAIVEMAKRSSTKLVLFAETGAWFGQEYCDTIGIDEVISEPFPFYIFEGHTVIRLHRASSTHGLK